MGKGVRKGVEAGEKKRKGGGEGREERRGGEGRGKVKGGREEERGR